MLVVVIFSIPFEQVIAPVRETCSQTLGSVLHYMTNESVGKVLKVLLTLQEQDLWQVRHGGHLGIKYVLALKKVRDTLEFGLIFSKHSPFELTRTTILIRIFKILQLSLCCHNKIFMDKNATGK